jgi:hypothetical protein
MTDKNREYAKNNCGTHELLVSYLYGEATPEEITKVQSHVNECRACAGELESFERVRSTLQHWQLDELPIMRVAVDPPRRSFAAVLKELFSISPWWAKAAAGLAMALLLFAVMGTEIKVGGGEGVSLRAGLLWRGQQATPESPNGLDTAQIERVRAEMKTLVTQLISDSERANQDEVKTRLVAVESQLQTMSVAELTKLASRVQQHQVKIRSLERDIDRREGMDLTDILFSEVTRSRNDETVAKGAGE